MKDDLTLVNEILKGDSNSFSELIKKYESPLYRFANSMVNNPEETQDIVQEVFITVYNKLYTYNKKYKFSNWIYRICQNKCIDHIRSNKREFPEISITENLVYNGISPEESVEFNEMVKLTDVFINNLKDMDKSILILRYMGNSFRDIGEILNMGEFTVKVRFYRIKERFKSTVLIKGGTIND